MARKTVLKKEKILIQGEVVASHPVMRNCTTEFSELTRTPSRIYLLVENNDQYGHKKYFSTCL